MGRYGQNACHVGGKDGLQGQFAANASIARSDTKQGRPFGRPCYDKKVLEGLLLFLQTELLDVDGLLMSNAILHGRLLEILAGAELANGTGLLEFALGQ